MDAKKYKTAASIRQVMKDRVAAEYRNLDTQLAGLKLTKERIHLYEGLLETTADSNVVINTDDASGEEGGKA